jgi:hypothetical protein
MTIDAPIEIVPGADPKGAVDATVMKIAKEKWSVSDGFDDMGGVHSRTSDDSDQEERVEVLFWLCVLLRDVMYCSEGYFVDLVNFYLPCVGFTIG